MFRRNAGTFISHFVTLLPLLRTPRIWDRAAHALAPPYNSQRMRAVDNPSRSRCEITKIVPARSHWIFIICRCRYRCSFFPPHAPSCAEIVENRPPLAVMSENHSDVRTRLRLALNSCKSDYRIRICAENFYDPADGYLSSAFPEVISDSWNTRRMRWEMLRDAVSCSINRRLSLSSHDFSWNGRTRYLIIVSRYNELRWNGVYFIIYGTNRKRAFWILFE